MNLRNMPPGLRTIAGLLIALGGLFFGVLFVLITIWLMIHLGFIATVASYIILLLVLACYLVFRRHRMRGHGFSTVRVWD